MGGGGEGVDALKLKRIAAAAYDYDNDPRWMEYWSNVLIPPHISSRSDVVDHFKRKFYQRYIDPNFIVEPMKTSRPSNSSSSAPPSGGTQRPSPGPTSRSSGTSANTATGPLRLDRKTIQFAMNAWALVGGILAIFPLVPASISNRAYRFCLLGFAFSSLYSLYSLYGLPRAWNVQALSAWFQSVAATKEIIYSIYCITFAPLSPCVKFALLPVFCFTIQNVVKFIRCNFRRSSFYRYLEGACLWVESNSLTLNNLSAQAEIGLGFLLIISLLSRQRNIIQAFMYWQLLKLMYHAPATAGYHQNTWSKIGQTVNPLVWRFAPFLRTPLCTIQKWWSR